MRIAFASIVLAAATSGQQPARDRGFGRCTGLDGKPWAGAEVHLMHRPHAAIAAPRFGEELVVTSDDRGQFKADLLVGSAYTAWAIGPVEADGTYRVTKVRSSAVARTPILLEESEQQYVRRLRPQLHASWQGHSPLRWRASLEGNRRLGLGQWLEQDADGVLTLPRWPGGMVQLQGWTERWMAHRTWQPLIASYVLRYGFDHQSKLAKPTRANVAEQMRAAYDVRVPPRRTRGVTLVDAASHAPIADAQVLLDNMPFDQTPQQSDPKGIVHAVFAHNEEMPREIPFQWTILPPANAEFAMDPSSYRDGDPPIMGRELPPAAR